MSAKIIVFASFHPNAGEEAEVEEILRRMVGPTRAEPGNEIYDLYRDDDTEEGESFHLFELYADQAALEQHRSTDHYRRYRATITAHLAAPIGVKVLDALDARG